MHVFQLFSTIKVNLMAKIIKRLFMCYLSCQAQKITISRSLNLISNSWYNPRWRPRRRPLSVTSRAFSSATTHKIYKIYLLRRSKAFHLRPNLFEMLQHIKNSREGGGGGGPSTPSPFYHGGGRNLRVRPRVKYTIFELFKVVVVEFLSK